MGIVEPGEVIRCGRTPVIREGLCQGCLDETVRALRKQIASRRDALIFDQATLARLTGASNPAQCMHPGEVAPICGAPLTDDGTRCLLGHQQGPDPIRALEARVKKLEQDVAELSRRAAPAIAASTLYK
jgi:hypothetical protein